MNGIPESEILGTLVRLGVHVKAPIWLFGGVAVDFLVGRWTRPHGDIDLVTFAEYRAEVARDLAELGYRSENAGWLTHWTRGDAEPVVELVFMERDATGDAVLVVREGDPVGVPGTYPTIAGYLDVSRWAELEGVRFRVCSPAGEWLARHRSAQLIPGRPLAGKIAHDLTLLQALISQEEMAALRTKVELPGEENAAHRVASRRVET